MRVVCAPDSFKESMSASCAAEAMTRGVLRVSPEADVVQVPLADGGEGTCSAMETSLGGERVSVNCTDPLGRPIIASFLHLPSRGMAVVEVAAAAGLELLTSQERDPGLTSSRGAGELLRAALDLDVREVLVGLGGSATNDAGAGMLSALGVRFLDSRGDSLPPGGAALMKLAEVDLSELDPRLRTVAITLASDVTNPLLGETGASGVFGPQKGASQELVRTLDAALQRWSGVVETATGRSVRSRPGAGAAGGLGAAFLAFTNAELRPGAEVVMEAVGVDSKLQGASVVLTGEGSWDIQSTMGKAPAAVAARAAGHGVPSVVLAGRVSPVEPLPRGVIAAVPILPAATELSRALRDGPVNLENATATTMRLLQQTLR